MVYAVLLVLLAWIGVAWARASLAPVSLVEAGYGHIERSVEAEAVLIRREEVVAAPFTGWTSYGVEEGEEVRAGAPVVELSNPRARAVTRLAAPVPGIVSYTVDGLEAVLVPEALKGLRGATLADLKERPAGSSKGQVRGGEPVFKVIDPSQVYFAIPVTGAEAEELPPRSAVRLRIATAGEREWDGLVERIGKSEADGRRLVVLSVPAAANEVALRRRVRATLVLEEAAGATVPVQVLLHRDEGWGLYLLRGNQARWHPVVVRISDGRTAALEGINPGALVVRRPQFVKEGQKIR